MDLTEAARWACAISGEMAGAVARRKVSPRKIEDWRTRAVELEKMLAALLMKEKKT